jgi:hypothetical protein
MGRLNEEVISANFIMKLAAANHGYLAPRANQIDARHDGI